MNFRHALEIQLAADPVEGREGRLKIGQGAFQLRRGAQPRAAAHQQVHAEIGLQPANPLPHGGRCDPQPPGGILQRPGPQGHVERLKRFEMGRALHALKPTFRRKPFQCRRERSAFGSERKSGLGFGPAACSVEASSEDAIRRHAELSGIPVGAITEVPQIIDPLTANN